MDIHKGVQSALTTIELESAAVKQLEQTIKSDEFEGVLRLLAGNPGRLVVTGIGKSAIIAQKIVATLNSTGTHALYMHAGDAVHGDLGIVRPEDLIICISKSGNTPEIRTLTTLIRQMGNILIGITSGKNSHLAEAAHHVLLIPSIREADPNNLAPTTSSTAQLALGDALAMALMTMKGFDAGDFARYHPGGHLGKQLLLTVADLIIHHEKPAVSPDADIRSVIIEISTKRQGATAVLDEQNNLTGIVTDGDLRRMLQTYHDWQGLTVSDIMTHNPKSVSPHTLATEALRVMRQYSITQLPVLDAGVYKGMVHIHDIIREGLVSG